MQFGIHDLFETNKLLFAIADLATASGTASSNSVEQLCSSNVYGGRKHNHAKMIEITSTLGFVARSGNRLALTPQGKIFLSHNPQRFYELTWAQKNIVIKSFVLGKLRAQSESIFKLFIEDRRLDTWMREIIDRPIPLSLNWLVSLMLGLELLHKEQSLLSVNKEYVPEITRLIKARTGLSPQELEKILGARRNQGEMGEKLVETFERKRLLSLGKVAEADLVNRISEIDTGAGFDIKSFDGKQSMIDYDRFIEVKTSTDTRIRFFWSKNEYETAQAYGDRYWIYFCGGFDQKKPDNFSLVIIQNPAKRLEDLGFTLTPSEYLVQFTESYLRGRQVTFGENLGATLL